MLTEEYGSLFDAHADGLVTAGNTAGVMGRGLALQFKQAFPGNLRAYQAVCRHGEVRLGRMFTWETGLPGQPKYVINFPTKGHWRSNSKLDDIKAGLASLRQVIGDYGIQSIAIPPLGCGNGGLYWRDVRQLIIQAHSYNADVQDIFYPHHSH